MTTTEIEAWEETSTFILDWELLRLMTSITDDRIQWFRAEANFEHWQERLESLHVEFMHVIARFTKDRDSWATLATQYSPTTGHVAYAKEHADMFESLRLDAEMKFRHV